VGEANIFRPVHYLSGSYPLLVVAASEQLIFYWNLQNLQQSFEPLGMTKTPVVSSTTSVCCFADGRGYVFGAAEGRAGVKNVDLASNTINPSIDFNFKCHRNDPGPPSQETEVYAMTGVSFNKEHNTFVTIGSDGNCNVWDKEKKSKLTTIKGIPDVPFTAAKMSESGGLLALAQGYDWHKGS
jgi:mRNA export factor